jgi:hypothetical protein
MYDLGGRPTQPDDPTRDCSDAAEGTLEARSLQVIIDLFRSKSFQSKGLSMGNRPIERPTGQEVKSEPGPIYSMPQGLTLGLRSERYVVFLSLPSSPGKDREDEYFFAVF